MQRFYVFMNEFEKKDEGGHTVKPYIRQIERLRHSTSNNLYLNCEDLYEDDSTMALYKFLVLEPETTLIFFDKAVMTFYGEMEDRGRDFNLGLRDLRVVPYNLATTRLLRELGVDSTVSMVQVEGIVIRMSNITPTLTEAKFRCSICRASQMVKQVGGRILEPQSCAKCNGKWTSELVHDESIYLDRQTIKLQEIPESVPQGETPMSVIMVAHADMVDQVRPGDRIKAVGILRAEPRRVQNSRLVVRTLYENFLDIVSYTRLNQRKQVNVGSPGVDLGYLGQEQLMEAEDMEQGVFSGEEVRKFKELADNPNVYSKLSDAIAPSIFECSDVKKGLLLQLFGAKEKKFEGLGRGRFRSEINVLLIGDPSTAKSQLLQFVNKISPRGIFTSGKSSSAVGLTAYVKRDPELNQPVLESGALVLSDRGICCIDEFDKMSENARSVLHEVMEQQTVSIAKAGIVCQLNARAAVLAAANPVFSKYQPGLTVVKNLNMPPSLLSRFDLIYLMLDPQMSSVDRQLSRHIISMYTRSGEKEKMREIDATIEPATLCAYISYARNNIHPKLTEPASQVIKESYQEMRRTGMQQKTISATTRQIESLIRLAEAHARMRLSDRVQVQDAEEAVRLMHVATQRAATNKDGLIDFSRIQSGIDENVRNNIKILVEKMEPVIREHQSDFRKGIRFN